MNYLITPFLVVSLFLLVCCDQVLGQERTSCPGCPKKVSLENENVVAAHAWFMEELRRKEDSYPLVKYLDSLVLTEASTQVVAGLNIRLVYNVVSLDTNGLYEVEIFRDLGQHYTIVKIEIKEE